MVTFAFCCQWFHFNESKVSTRTSFSDGSKTLDRHKRIRSFLVTPLCAPIIRFPLRFVHAITSIRLPLQLTTVFQPLLRTRPLASLGGTLN